jgi:hypothetical protein
MVRRAVLPALAILLLIGSVARVSAASRPPHARRLPHVTVSAEGAGTLIAVTYLNGARLCVRLLHAREAIDRVALADIDNDGHVDILAAPRNGALVLWRNAGHGRFARAALPRGAPRLVTRGPRIARIAKMDDGWQWGDDRHDAALPRAPDVIGDVPIAAFRVTPPLYVRPVSFRRFSGRAPPAL